ncbi:MAG: methylenetetrahydrofolate reductase [NAD(P)H] [Clostridiales bacterium]|nr:methylenetetrahydrofolate reductase [NAD(P)H] [Clostridiales bacterium]
MSIPQLFKQGRVLSLEVFPPKPDSPIEVIDKTLDRLAPLKPDYISVTYGAGGSGRSRSVEIAKKILPICKCLSHLTCVGADAAEIDSVLDSLKEAGISDIMALRGDIPKDMDAESAFVHYQHASDLITHIKNRGDFDMGAACYPEGHPQSDSLMEDIDNLKRKVDAGAQFLVTQLFFDNVLFYRFMEQLRRRGVHVPVTAGIMPVLNAAQIVRMTLLSGTSVPPELAKIIARYGDNPADFRKAGLEFAMDQVSGLMANGVQGIHLYTMNKADAITEIIKETGLR